MERIKMSVNQWIAIHDNPRQRDTESHARRAARGHLASPSPTHASVAAARLPGGMLVKLDGHTRAHLWGAGSLGQPACVFVDVYSVSSIEEAKELYTHFDNSAATETAKDRVFGALRECGIFPSSPLIKAGGLASALKIITGSRDVYSACSAWRRQISALDDLGIGLTKKSTGVIAGSLAVLRVRADRGAQFISLVGADRGTRGAAGSDGVDSVCRLIHEKTLQAGERASLDFAERFVSGAEAWMNGRYYTTKPKRTDIRHYIERAQ